MKNRLITVLSCAAVSVMGITGCNNSSGGTPPSEEPRESGYNIPVVIDENTTWNAIAVAKIPTFLLPSNPLSMASASKGDSELSDSKNVGVQMMERLSSLKIPEGKIPSMPDGHHEINVADLPCPVSGTYDLNLSLDILSTPIPPEGGIDQGATTYKITFNNCTAGIDDPMLDGAFINLEEGLFSTLQPTVLYTGSLTTVYRGSEGETIETGPFEQVDREVYADNLEVSIEGDEGTMIIDADANLTFTETSTMSGREGLEFALNGTLGMMDEYNASPSQAGVTGEWLDFEAKDFVLSNNFIYPDGGVQYYLSLDGYVGLTLGASYDDALMPVSAPADIVEVAGDTLYIYAEALEIRAEYSGPETEATINGILGLPCFGEEGGTVEYTTTDSLWFDAGIRGIHDSEYGKTPVDGSVTISGAEESEAVVNFDLNVSGWEPLSYGEVTIGDWTSDPFSLQEVELDCDIDILPEI